MADKPEKLVPAGGLASRKSRDWRREMKARGKKFDKNGRVIPADPKAQDPPLVEFTDAVDFNALVDVLDTSEDARAHTLANLLCDPRQKRINFALAIRTAGLTLQDLNELWRKHNLAAGMVESASNMRKLIKDLSTDALSSHVVCPRCDGTGQIVRAQKDATGAIAEVEAACPQCKGAREIRQPGNPKAIDKTLAIFEVGQRTSPLVAIQQNFEGSFEDTVGAAQDAVQIPRGDVREVPDDDQ
jgi:hypothetical protein